MADNIIHMADIKNDNTLISPIDTLKDAIKAIEAGEIKPDKLMVISLDTDPPNKAKPGAGYLVKWFLSDLRASEVVALLEVSKQDFLATLTGGD
ncbi:MAG: hypothetical protein KAI73_05010 [Rhodospirillaceae bacterium]|nr:hypothetical protein [Rhodospirillaceae bacterium]